MSVAEQHSGKPAISLKDADFNWEDPLDLESELTEEERMVRDTARGYAQEKLFPRVLQAYREESFDRAIMTEMGDRKSTRLNSSHTVISYAVFCLKKKNN